MAHELERLLPDFTDKCVLDIGCGFGWHCIYAAAHGAASVTGVDLSEKMQAVAKEKTDSPAVTYLCMAMEDMDFAPESFDAVISSLAFHYTPDFRAVCEKVRRFLTPGGSFVFSVEHPVFTAQGPQNWVYDEDGKQLHWPVDSYFAEGTRTAMFLGEEVTKYHWTLTSYVGSLLATDFTITGLVEPQPPEHMLKSVSGMSDELRRPMMLMLSARKQ